MKKTVVIVDTNNLLYRMFHTQPPRIFKGQRVESMKASVSAIMRLSESTPVGKPEKVVAVFDAPGKTFRDEMFVDYKTNRKGMPDELKQQESSLKEVLSAIGVPVISKEGVEADDAIGMLAAHFNSKGYFVLIFSNDKDILQLVSDDVAVMNPSVKTLMDSAAVVEKLGVPPSLVVDFLALKGDAADNIPGVDGVGEKTAEKLLNTYGSLQNLVENAEKIKGVIGTRISEFKEQSVVNMLLCAIKRDPLGLTNAEIEEVENSKGSMSACKAMSQRYGIDVKPKAESTEPDHVAAEKPVSKKESPDKEQGQMSLF